MKNKIESVTVCVDYSDFLAWTLPNNRVLFDKTVVVTSERDTKTINLCKTYGVKFTCTDIFWEGQAKFNKFAGINLGLEQLDKDGWVCVWDADMFFHPKGIHMLKEMTLNPQFLYGCDRFCVHGIQEWIEYYMNPNIVIDNWLVNMSRLEVGGRIVQYYDSGWFPLGFFQLWNPLISGINTYPEGNGGADHGDVIHAKKWSRSWRVLLPEVIAIHLDSIKSEMGANWQGRTTPNFNSYQK